MTRTRRLLVVGLIAGSLAIPCETIAQDLGTFQGRFALQGQIPKRKAGDDSLIVDGKSKGIQNIVIYLQKRPARGPAIAESPWREPVALTVKNREFSPRVLMLRTGRQVRFQHDGKRNHYPHPYPFANREHGYTLVAGGLSTWQYDLPEPIPMKVVCDLHTSMRAYWVVLDHPYSAVTDRRGAFQITGLPAGTHQFRVWHERTGWVVKSWEVTVQGGETTDLGTQFVPSAKFAEP